MKSQILIVDHDPSEQRLTKVAIEDAGYDGHLAQNAAQAMQRLHQRDPQIDCMVVDLSRPETDGLALLQAMSDAAMSTPVIIQIDRAASDHLAEAMKAGAFDFVVKAAPPEQLLAKIANALKVERQYSKIKAASHGRRNEGFRSLVCDSPAMERVLNLARRAASSDIPVVVEGESGVGKSVMARAIHMAGERRTKPFVTVDCRLLDEDNAHGILFGHDHDEDDANKAASAQPGKIHEADGGTLFLQEIGNLPLGVQVKLLHAMESGKIEPVGTQNSLKRDIRLISATSKDLIHEVREGRFREDLYYRVNVFPIMIPALRKRPEDIPMLARALATRFDAESGLAGPIRIGTDVMDMLMLYDWPGNVVELEKTILRAIILSQEPILEVDLFPQIAAQVPGFEMARFMPARASHDRIDAIETAAASGSLDALRQKNQFRSPSPPLPGSLQEGREKLARAFATAEFDASSPAPSMIPSVDEKGDLRSLADVEEQLIRFALLFYNGQMTKIARKLGIGRSTLYRKLKDYNIDPDKPFKDVA